jgi:hypothetical protein
VCNPNIIIDYNKPFPVSKRGGISRTEAEQALKDRDLLPVKHGIKRCDPPKKINPRSQGRVHLNGPETVHSLVPLSIKGMRWDEKKRVYDNNGVRKGELISGTYEQKELYGSLRSFGGERSRTFSHKNNLLPSNASVAYEIEHGVTGLNICSEWEKKIMTTQGKIPQLKSFAEAFTLSDDSSPYFGSYFKWEVDAIERRAEKGFGKSLYTKTMNATTPTKGLTNGGPTKGGQGGGHLYTTSGGRVPGLNMDKVDFGKGNF